MSVPPPYWQVGTLQRDWTDGDGNFGCHSTPVMVCGKCGALVGEMNLHSLAHLDCSTCEDVGYITVSDHVCDGNDRICAEACPAPIQVRCPDCPQPESTVPLDPDEEPF